MDTQQTHPQTCPIQLNKEQKGVRMLLCMGVDLTNEEALTVLDSLYKDWPQELKDKTGNFGLTVEAEDRMAQEAASSPSPAK